MVKRITMLLLISLAFIFASEYLVRVDLTEERLAPFAEKGLKVIEELENSAILLIDHEDFDKILSHSYEILDQYPEEGRYYLVHTLDSKTDLSKYGEILWGEGDDYLIKIDEGMLEDMMKERVMLKRITLEPIIIKSEASPQQFRADTTVQEIVDLVDPDSVLSFVQRLQDFRTRYSLTDSCAAAANWIASKFIEYGCDSVFFQDHTGGHASNVIGVKRGVVYPDSIYVVISGHFDSYSYIDPWTEAPGADDDAGGTTGAIEAARVMQDYDFEYSVRYCGWSGEEFGLYGSAYYASTASAQGDSILGVVQADMIGYTDVLPETLEVIAKISNPACGWLADFFIAAADTYTTLLTNKVMTSYWPWSDHSSFWDNGYSAILLIEDDLPLPNPYYHYPSDTIGAGYNNNDFCTETIKAMVATTSLLAVPYYHDPGVEENEDMVSHNTLLTIYPNVGSSRFTISFTINNPNADATLKIYDVAGMLVRSFDPDGLRTKGQFDHATIGLSDQITWHGTDDSGQKLPSGIYIVRLDVKESSATAKLIMLK